MKIELKFFHSRVARRIFLLFVVSALIPVILLALFQFMQMDRQLKEKSHMQLRQDVKNMGMQLIGQLFNLESQINLLGRGLETALAEKKLPAKSGHWAQLAPDFTALTVMNLDTKPVSLKGKLLSLPKKMPALPLHGTWISLSNVPNSGDKQVLLVHKVDFGHFLIGEVQLDWNFDLHPGALIWVLNYDRQVVYTNSPTSVPPQLSQYMANQDTGTFTWSFNDRNYLVGYWHLFLRERLHSGKWLVVLAEPETNIFVQAQKLYLIFLPTILFALILSMLLSQAQIRRILVPLEELSKATRRVARRDFTPMVTVKSNDEFEELAEAFNKMSKRLQHQFKTLSIMSSLDQAILSTQDAEEILHIIFKELDELVDYDLLILGVLERDDEHAMQLMIDSPVYEIPKVQKAFISDSEIEALRNNKNIILNLAEADPPGYLNVLAQYHMQHTLIFPILHRTQPVAIICLGFANAAALKECRTEELADIFYRAAVAFTYAEWEERLYRQAHYDDLTNLPNRLFLRDEMNQALERASLYGKHCVLMFIDLDNFKDINDTLGHAVGDRFLNKVAHRMHNVIGKYGLLARIGGDEFTLLMGDLANKETAKQKATEAAEALLHSFLRSFYLGEVEYHASASVGIVFYPDDCKTSDELFKFADMSMYEAKKMGKNNYVFFSAQLETSIRERNQLMQEMHTALEEEQFIVYFQPKVNSKKGELVGAEALIRWQHPTRGLLFPDLFMPLAEESNLIFSIGEWVVQAACKQLYTWKKQGYKLSTLALNITAKQFTQKDLGNRIQRIIEQTGISPKDLEFEVTESAFIANFDESNLILNQLSWLGCRLSLDDFGTGYSSMHYLHKLHLDTMKIDRIFITSLPDDKKNISIIKAIITLAKNLNLELVAEGVETKAQSELLCELGCAIQQGFYFSKPLPADEFESKFLMKQ
ncbi:EAL domain-containing protein [Legionella sp. 27cVA30]|uniref:EAL domain-containing protein n=1 Tax=Legionella sp. 27cVA30 TaxID=2905657 RepID=UPI00209F89DB|nr:EAL domain-containing protein [Legionella sp. 27cVA30]MCP0913659.1 EAL domain-containing protein [Legionella sp. 27cVA30]